MAYKPVSASLGCLAASLAIVSLLTLVIPARAIAAAYSLTIQAQDSSLGQNLDLATITSDPAGINCGQGHKQCSATFDEGTALLLTANGFNVKNIVFRWHPDVITFHASKIPGPAYMPCEGIDDYGQPANSLCKATIPQHNAVLNAQASYIHSELRVEKSGNGSGRVTNQNPVKPPLLIDCGLVCSTDFSDGLILFAIADPGSAFGGWKIDGSTAATYCTYDKLGNPNCANSYEVHPRGDGKPVVYTANFEKIKSGSAATAPTSNPKTNLGAVPATSAPNDPISADSNQPTSKNSVQPAANTSSNWPLITSLVIAGFVITAGTALLCSQKLRHRTIEILNRVRNRFR